MGMYTNTFSSFKLNNIFQFQCLPNISYRVYERPSDLLSEYLVRMLQMLSVDITIMLVVTLHHHHHLGLTPIFGVSFLEDLLRG